jgi:hypothetical protein
MTVKRLRLTPALPFAQEPAPPGAAVLPPTIAIMPPRAILALIL